MASSLVLELQQLASDTNIKVSSLLPKAKMVAAKLCLDDLKDTFSAELVGYRDVSPADVPPYRTVLGSIKIHNPYHGLVPITILDEQTRKTITKTYITNSMEEIERFIAESSRDAVWTVPLPGPAEKYIRESVDVMGMPVMNVVDTSQMVGITAAVRGIILDWALDLEARGILGQGFAFSEKEKNDAQGSAVGTTVINTTYNIGTNQGIAGDIERSSVSQDYSITVPIGDKRALFDFLQGAGVDEDDIRALGNAIDAEPTVKGRQVGEKVGSWIGDMVQKAATGAWKMAADKGAALITAAIKNYYGL